MMEPIYIGHVDGGVGQLDSDIRSDQIEEVLQIAAIYGWREIDAEEYERMKSALESIGEQILVEFKDGGRENDAEFRTDEADVV